MSYSERAQRIIDAARLKIVSKNNPLLEDIEWLEDYRPHQVKAIKEVLQGFEHGRLVCVDAPTGSGKTLIGETVRRLLGVRGLYCCNSILLQEQVANDFPDARVLMGRSNYAPELYPDGGSWGVTCADCTKTDEAGCGLCSSVHSCPYERAKAEALAVPLAIVNTTYLLTEGNGPGRLRGRPLVILDEADTLEQELMKYVSVDIPRSRCLRLGLHEPRKVTVASSWREWLDDAIPRVRRAKDSVRGENLRAQRERNALGRLLGKLRAIDNIEDGWVYTGKGGHISFKPVSVERWGDLLWGLGDRFLLMSATLISPGALLDSLGWKEQYSTVTVPSTFPKENRKVVVQPVAKITRKNDNGPKELIEPLQQIIRRHNTEHMLVHCVSYRLAEYLCSELSGSCREVGMECTSYSSSDGKSEALARFLDSKCGVLFASSMDRGVDLPDDQCRVIVIAKVPYPFLGDRQVSARLHSKGGQVWYTVQTVRTVVQMTGRGVRHSEDRCKTYVLDTQFLDLWNKARGMFPKWWTEALEWNR